MEVRLAMTGTGAKIDAPAEPYRASEEDIVASAKAAIDEARRHIDFQVKQADAIDTKTAAIMTLAGAAAGLSVGRLHLNTDAQRLPAIVTLIVLVALLSFAIQALRPRGGWSYGANPADIAQAADRAAHSVVIQKLALALAEARKKNVAVLDAKHRYYQAALLTVVIFLLALGWMLQSGALAD